MAEPIQLSSQRSLRADAELNRVRIVDAARKAFAEKGLGARLDDVARGAGVSVATLYRRFPSRADLVAAAFERTLMTCADAVEQALRDPDEWSGFRTFIERICAMQAEDQGFAQILTMTFLGARRFETERARMYSGLVELIERAQKAGRLRTDFVPEDLGLLLMANAGVIAATAGTAPGASTRLVAFMLQAFDSTSLCPLPPPPTSREMYRALVRVQRGVKIRI